MKYQARVEIYSRWAGFQLVAQKNFPHPYLIAYLWVRLMACWTDFKTPQIYDKIVWKVVVLSS